jgi:tetratricopeptide (TPR) repeat protein
MRVLMILFAVVALIWVFNKNISHKVEVALWEPPLPQEYIIINKVMQDIATTEVKNSIQMLRSPVWDTIENNKEALKKEIIKALPHYANKAEIFAVTNLLYQSEMPKYTKHAYLLAMYYSGQSNVKDKTIEKLEAGDRKLFKSILSYLEPAGEKAKEICDSYSYTTCDSYVYVLINLGSVYNIQQKYESAIPYLKTAIEHLDCFENKKSTSMEQEAHTQLGLSYLRLKQFDDAASEFEAFKPKSISFSIKMFGWKKELATGLKKAGYTEEAKAYWEKEVDFWEKEIAENTEDEQHLKIKRKMKEKAEIFLSDLSK